MGHIIPCKNYLILTNTPPFQILVTMVTYAWSMAAMTWKVVWKAVWIVSGVPSALMDGQPKTAMLSVNSWDSGAQVCQIYYPYDSL